MKKVMLLVSLLLVMGAVNAEGDFVNGAQVWAEVCGGCHAPRNPAGMNDNQWVTSISHMRVRSGITGQEVKDVVAFLQAANGEEPVSNATTPNGNAIVNLTGYGSLDYSQPEGKAGEFSAIIAPILQLQIGDKWFFDAEVELSATQSGETEGMLEYATANYFLNDYMTIVAGQFMSPIGQFKQNLHPTWINRLPTMPMGFMYGGAAPSGDFGLQLRGALPIGKLRSSYALFVSTGPELVGSYDDEHGEFTLKAIDASANYTDVDRPVYGGRWVMNPARGFEFGFSFASGVATVTAIEGWTAVADVHDEEEEEGEHHGDEEEDGHGDEPVDDHDDEEEDGHGDEEEGDHGDEEEAGHGDEEEEAAGGHHGGASNATMISGEAARSYRVIGADVSLTWRNLNIRGEYARSTVGAADMGISASEGREWTVWYTQAVYNIPSTKLQAVARYTKFDDKVRKTFGLNYLVSDTVTVKAALEVNANDQRVIVQLAFGF